MPSKRSRIRLASLVSRSPRDVVVVAIIFALLGVAFTWPIAADLAGRSVAGAANNDLFLNQYLIAWGAHALGTSPASLYHPNMFYPARYTFAYADMLLSNSVLMAPILFATGDPTLTYNLLLLTSMLIGGVGFYVLARYVVRSQTAALAGALVFVFNPVHFSRYLQPQLFTDHWLPWLVWSLLLWLECCGLRAPAPAEEPRGPRPERALRWAGLTAILFCLHALTGSHNAVFGTLLCTAILAFHGARAALTGSFRRAAGRRLLQGAAAGVTICTAVLLPAFYPYVASFDLLVEQRMTTGAGEAAVLHEGSARLPELLLGSSRIYAWLEQAVGWPTRVLPSDRAAQGELFPGVVPLALAAVGVLAGADRVRRRGALAAGLDGIGLCAAGAALAGMAAATPWIEVLGVRLSLGLLPWLFLAAVVAAAGRLALTPGVPHLLRRAREGVPAAWKHDPDLLLWLGLAVAGLVLALGPSTWLYALVEAIPGARLIRVPRRFLLPGALALSLLAARGVAAMLRRRRSATGPTLAVLAVLFLGESLHAPLPTAPPPYPREPVHEWLAQQPGDFAVLEVPISADPTAATRQMIGSTYHWKKLLVGYSGSVPPGYLEWIARMEREFPDEQALDELQQRDVRFVLAVESRISADLAARIDSSSRLRPVHRFAGLQVYELMPPGSGP